MERRRWIFVMSAVFFCALAVWTWRVLLPVDEGSVDTAAVKAVELPTLEQNIVFTRPNLDAIGSPEFVDHDKDQRVKDRTPEEKSNPAVIID